MSPDLEPYPPDVPMAKNGRPLMSTELKEFLSLIRTGKLFAVQEWLNTKGYVFAAEWRKSPLFVAVESGFHSMVEVLLDANPSQKEKDTALEYAVYGRRLDLIKLLIEKGASPATVSFFDVCYQGHPFIVRFFEELGADMVTGDPIFGALKRCSHSALQVCKRHIKTSPDVQRQADEALRYHVEKGNAKWVSLLLWAGADPRSAPEGEHSALQIAVREGTDDVLKPLRRVILDSDLNGLLVPACLGGRTALVREFLEKGADPNTQGAYGNCLPLLLGVLAWQEKNLTRRDKILSLVECIKVLLTAGARWDASQGGKGEVADARKALLRLTETQSMELIQLMHETGALGDSFELFCCTKSVRDRFRGWLDSRYRCKDPRLRLIFPESAFLRKRRKRRIVS